MRKLLLVGSNSIHTYNYYNLISDYFDEILLITNMQPELNNISSFQVNFSIKNPFIAYSTIKRLRKEILNFKPSLIHIHQSGTGAFLILKAAKNLNIPIVLTAWGSDILLMPNFGWLYKRMAKYNLQHSNYLTSDSFYMASEMKKLVPGKNLDITIANFGINISISNVPKENIIYSNRLHKKLYRIDKVIEAFCRFNENRINENWKLIIAGSGEETDKLKGIVRDLNIQKNVEFIGWANNNLNADYYNRSKIFVSIPESDATSISLLEAMATGCIPILSDLPSNKEWITDGLNGIIVNNISVNFLEQIMSLNMDKAMEINRNIIQQKGTKEVNKKNFIELYNRILLNNK